MSEKKFQTKRLGSDTRYKRPSTGTITDSLQTQSAMMEKLKNYVRVDDIDLVALSTHVRYVTLDKDGVQCFRLGGILTKKADDYVVLSNGKFSWSVQKYHWKHGKPRSDDEEPVFITAFWKIKTKQDVMQEKLVRQQQEIQRLRQKLTATQRLRQQQDIQRQRQHRQHRQ